MIVLIGVYISYATPGGIILQRGSNEEDGEQVECAHNMSPTASVMRKVPLK